MEGEKDRVKQAEQSADYYLDRIEELTHKLSQAETKLKGHDDAKVEQGAKVRTRCCERALLDSDSGGYFTGFLEREFEQWCLWLVGTLTQLYY